LREPAKIVPVIYNEITGDYDPIYPVAGGSTPRVDAARGLVTFDVQVLGVFALTATR